MSHRSGYGLSIKGCSDRFFEIMMCGAWTLLADGKVSIVDLAVIHLVQMAVVYRKDRGFRGCCDMGHLNERVLRIEYRVAFNRKLALVFTNQVRGVFRIWENPPKTDLTRIEFALQLSDLRGVAVRDRTFACGKKKHNNTCIR
jgi:hypothetical protein